MLSFEGYTLLIMFFILAPILGAFTLLFLFIFEKRFDLLESRNKKIALEKELQAANYNQLNQQIQPHFLFNALNVILSLARLKRTEQLIKALEVLSLFLKSKYKTSDALIKLKQEIKYTQHYLDIQKLRFGERLQININYREELNEALIPPFVLQTLVENAFKHGLEKKIGDALLNIFLFLEEEMIVLQVIDNGSNHTFTNNKNGHGLENIRKRLNLLFDEHASLRISKIEDRETIVEIKWPFIKDYKMNEVEK